MEDHASRSTAGKSGGEDYKDPCPSGLGATQREMILNVVGSLPALPAPFLQDLKSFLDEWGQAGAEKCSGEPEIGEIPLRPYRVRELASQPGAPSRGTIYKILRELKIPLDRSRCADGRLSVETVRAILSYRKGPSPCHNPHGRPGQNRKKQ